MANDDRMSDIPRFNPDPHKEIKEGHPQLVHTLNTSMMIKTQVTYGDLNFI